MGHAILSFIMLGVLITGMVKAGFPVFSILLTTVGVMGITVLIVSLMGRKTANMTAAQRDIHVSEKLGIYLSDDEKAEMLRTERLYKEYRAKQKDHTVTEEQKARDPEFHAMMDKQLAKMDKDMQTYSNGWFD